MFLIALVTDLIAITILAYVLYFRRHRRRDLLLAFVSLNIGVLAVTVALSAIEVGLGLGIGLFGILSIIRLRSDQITQREIAYYFVSIVLGLLAGLHPGPVWLTPVLSALAVAVVFLLDHPKVAAKYERTQVRLDAALFDEDSVRSHLVRLGFADPRVEILAVDLVRDTTDVDVRHRRHPRRPLPTVPQQVAAWTAPAPGAEMAQQPAPGYGHVAGAPGGGEQMVGAGRWA